VSQAAHILGLPQRTAYAYIHSGIIPAVRVSHRILVLRATVEKLLKEGKFLKPVPVPFEEDAW